MILVYKDSLRISMIILGTCRFHEGQCNCPDNGEPFTWYCPRFVIKEVS